MNSAIVDHYRCPEALIETTLAGGLSTASRPFYFGGDTLCYGQLADLPDYVAGPGAVPDVFGATRTCGSGVCLPFDPSQIVENLRRERYMADCYFGRRDVLSGPLIRDVYYLLRPFMSVAVRRHLQRFALRGWKELPFPNGPWIRPWNGSWRGSSFSP